MKPLCKTLVEFLALVLVLPVVACCRLGMGVFGPVQGFAGWSQAMSLIPGLPGVYLRRAFYRQVLPRCEAGTCISFGTVVSHPTAELGRSVYVGNYCVLGDVTLEDDVLLGSQVSIINGNRQHGTERLDLPIREQPGQWPRVTIGRDSWIGDRAVVQADVGKHCVIGSGAVVTKAIPDYAVAVGVPAKVIRYRNEPALQTATSAPPPTHDG